MKTLKLLFFVTLITFFSACEKDLVFPDLGMLEDEATYKSSQKGFLYNATGSVEIEWKGANKGGGKGNKPDALLTFFDFNAKQKDLNSEAKGEMVYLVLETDFSAHREIRAEVKGMYIYKESKKAWILGRVISDTKGCTGNGSGGHDSGCSDDHAEGGCTDDHTDGGCTDDHSDGDSSGDDSHDGGCSHDDTDSDSGCSDDSSDDTDHGSKGGPGGIGSDKGNPLSGKNCRLGQIIAVKLHDGGSPGTKGDGISWKWFDPEGANAPTIEEWSACEEWNLLPHLCKKTIIGGNLVIHK